MADDKTNDSSGTRFFDILDWAESSELALQKHVSKLRQRCLCSNTGARKGRLLSDVGCAKP